MGHGISGVEGEVQQELLRLREVRLHAAEPATRSDLDLHVLADDPLQHPVELRGDRVHVDEAWARVGTAAEREQLAGQRGGALGGLERRRKAREGGVLGGELAAGQLDLAGDHEEQVVEVVDDAAGQATEGLQALRAGLRLRGSVHAGVAQLEQDARHSLHLTRDGPIGEADVRAALRRVALVRGDVEYRDARRGRAALQARDHGDRVRAPRRVPHHDEIGRPLRRVVGQRAPPGSLDLTEALEPLEVVDDPGQKDGRRAHRPSGLGRGRGVGLGEPGFRPRSPTTSAPLQAPRATPGARTWTDRSAADPSSGRRSRTGAWPLLLLNREVIPATTKCISSV